MYGRLAEITWPTPGNHEWGLHREGYDPYWRSVTGRRQRPWYRVRLAGWEIFSLNSEAPHGPRSRQLGWLRARLAGAEGDCRIAFWHRPRFNAGTKHGDGDAGLQTLWSALSGHAKLVLNGHDHNMQRLDRTQGLVEMVSGAGGEGQYPIDPGYPTLAFGNDTDSGALRLRLGPRRLRYAFIALDGSKLDSGVLRCRPIG